ncbi:MAG: GNAT family N-acetyltransferase [Ilumatobacteraceae bacterium]
MSPPAPDRRDEWSVAIVLADGDTAYIRPITVADAPLLLAFHEAQPREDLYLRFFSAKPTLSEKELRHFTDIDFHDRVALVMEYRGEFIAWASYERWPGRADADVAFMVDRLHRGRGIATLLLEHLAAIARSNGIARFTAEVLYENKAMTRVFVRAGWPVKRRFDSGVTELEFSLTDTEQFIDSVEQREHRADSSSVARLLLPRTVAVIGASDRKGTAGHELWHNVSQSFEGPVYPVNSRRATVGGRKAYASVGDIDDDIWLAVIAVPASALKATIESCIAKRVRGAVVITAVDSHRPDSHGQDDSAVDVDALVAHARRNGLRIIGPASMGVASPNATRPLQAALAPVLLPHGAVAISMQSGSLGASLLQLAGRLSMGLSWFVSLGDKSDVSGNDLLQFWEDDEHTRVIAMYTESFGNPRKFARIARRVGRTRPIVAVRAGAAAIGSGNEALYQQAGLIEVPSVRSMLDTARVLADQPVPAGPNVALLTNSRSPGVLARAALTNAGLTVVEPLVQLDWRSSPTDFAEAVVAAVADPGVDAVLVIHAPAIATSPGPTHEIDGAAVGSGKPVVAVMLGHADGPICPGSKVPTFSFPESAAAVLGRIYAYGSWLSREHDDTVDAITDADADAAIQLLTSATAELADGTGTATLDIAQSAALLATYGLVVTPARHVAGDADQVVAAADELGYPVALKAVHRRIGRSAEAGIALDLADAKAVRSSLEVIRHALGATGDELIVQQMASPGVDVRLHCTVDSHVGAVVAIGLGSRQFEPPAAFAATRLAPLSRSSASRALQASQVGDALAAAGLPSDAVVDALVRVSWLIADHREIAEIDINPLIVSSAGSSVTDVRIVVRPAGDALRPMRRLA